jgi:hypothetical protein
MIWRLDGRDPDTDWPWPGVMFIVVLQFNLISLSFMIVSQFDSVA